MAEQTKTELSCGEYGRPLLWYPLRKWWQSSRLFGQDVGLPPLLEPGDARWKDVDWLQRSLAACSWPGYIPAPLFVPHISESTHHPGQKISQWRVSMDVAHFSPSEISLSVRDGFLEVGGKHEERPDEHGFIARCFTRKYRLPAEMDVTKLTSTLSVDGILTVEAPVPETSVPAAFIIPIKVEIETPGEEEVKHEEEEAEAAASHTEAEIPSAEDHGEQPPLETHDGQVQPGSATGEIQEEEEKEEKEAKEEKEEETLEKPEAESQPSVPADDKGTESLQDTSEHQETTESQETADPSKLLEQKEAAVDGEMEGMAGSGEVAEEMIQPEEQEQEQKPDQEQVQEPVQEQVQEQEQKPDQEPVQEPVQEPIQEPVQEQVQELIQEQVQEQVQELKSTDIKQEHIE